MGPAATSTVTPPPDFYSSEDALSLYASDEDDLQRLALPSPWPLGFNLAAALHPVVEYAARSLEIPCSDVPPTSHSRLDGCYFGQSPHG